MARDLFCIFYSQPKCDHVCCCLSAVKFLRYVSPRVSSQHCLARGTRLMTSNNLSLWCWSLGCGLSVGLASMVLLSSQVVGTDTYSVRQKNVVADPPLLFRLSLGQKKNRLELNYCREARPEQHVHRILVHSSSSILTSTNGDLMFSFQPIVSLVLALFLGRDR